MKTKLIGTGKNKHKGGGTGHEEADMGPSMKRYRPRAQGRAFAIKKQTCHISISVAPSIESMNSEVSN